MSRRSSRIATAIVSPAANIVSATAATPTKAKKVESTAITSTKKTSATSAKDIENVINTTIKSQEVAPTRKRKAASELSPEPVNDGKGRCSWAASSRHPLLQQYHDTEWCISGGFNRTNRYLFEMLILEGAQAGLSWSTVLNKRDAYREAYDNFDYNVITNTYISPASNERLLKTNIVKNKLKVEASMINAKAFRDLLLERYPDQAQPEDENGFWHFLQAYKKQESIETGRNGSSENKKKLQSKEPPQVYLTSNEASDRLSADLKNLGFKFVGTTIMYSYLQAVGIELEGTHHTESCFKHPKNM
ncbi:hypothetical protein BGX21_010823 [Mortierella sp. AD011]|nr:hypothetical protein BGX20_011380 [Mortierella sp. AD010]KAF9402237.1 hypothetical protein BGX21_010823 [Mortierella sp. AD011]